MDKTRNKKGYDVELSEFRTEFIIHCPICNNKTTLTNNSPSKFIEGKIACLTCGFNIKLEENSSYGISTVDGQIIESKITMENPKGLKLTLWYSKNFKGNSFWAYNENHLKFLNEFINVKHRARSQENLKNRSIGSRLPKWITSSVNRKEISKLIEGML
jgi:transcription elongation factor Elf1